MEILTINNDIITFCVKVKYAAQYSKMHNIFSLDGLRFIMNLKEKMH